MIIKSMSRKVPSFGQLIGYIDRDEGNENYTMRHNLMGRDPELMRSEFEMNSDLLQKRKNGVYLYHEIISITRAEGLEASAQKNRLYDIAQTYVDARCPDNMVFGGLHEDKDHSYHMHLMISANRAGDAKRLRLTKAQFREIQIHTERHVLEKYPELEQKVAIEKQSDRRIGKGEAELERRTGNRPKREEVLDRVTAAFEQSQDKQSLLDALGRENLELYVRGKTLGVTDLESGKNHRLKTLDLEMADRVSIRMSGEDQVKEPEPEIEDALNQGHDPSGPDRVEPEQEEVREKKPEERAAEPETERAAKTERRSADEKDRGAGEKEKGRRKKEEAAREEKPRRSKRERADKDRKQQRDRKVRDKGGREQDQERSGPKRTKRPRAENDKTRRKDPKGERDTRRSQESRQPSQDQEGQVSDTQKTKDQDAEQSRGNPIFSFGKRVMNTVMKTTENAMHELEEAGKIVRQGLTGQDEDIGKSKAEKEAENFEDLKKKGRGENDEFGREHREGHKPDDDERVSAGEKEKGREGIDEQGHEGASKEQDPRQAWREEMQQRRGAERDDGDRGRE